MRRILLSPAWWGRHVLMVVLVAAFAFLGRWQWDKAISPSGSLQNLLYAFEWWVFAGLVIVGWAHLMRDELRGMPAQTSLADADADLPEFAKPHQRVAPPPVATRTPEDEAADAELAAYNEYLAWLNAHPRR